MTHTGMRVRTMQAAPPATAAVFSMPGQLSLILLGEALHDLRLFGLAQGGQLGFELTTRHGDCGSRGHDRPATL